MELKKLPYNLTVCKAADLAGFDPKADFYFLGKTDEELSLVCPGAEVPDRVPAR